RLFEVGSMSAGLHALSDNGIHPTGFHRQPVRHRGDHADHLDATTVTFSHQSGPWVPDRNALAGHALVEHSLTRAGDEVGRQRRGGCDWWKPNGCPYRIQGGLDFLYDVVRRSACAS